MQYLNRVMSSKITEPSDGAERSESWICETENRTGKMEGELERTEKEIREWKDNKIHWKQQQTPMEWP